MHFSKYGRYNHPAGDYFRVDYQYRCMPDARPGISNDTRVRVIDIARELEPDSYPFQSHEKALKVILDYAEQSIREDKEKDNSTPEPDFAVGDTPFSRRDTPRNSGTFK